MRSGRRRRPTTADRAWCEFVLAWIWFSSASSPSRRDNWLQPDLLHQPLLRDDRRNPDPLGHRSCRRKMCNGLCSNTAPRVPQNDQQRGGWTSEDMPALEHLPDDNGDQTDGQPARLILSMRFLPSRRLRRRHFADDLGAQTGDGLAVQLTDPRLVTPMTSPIRAG